MSKDTFLQVPQLKAVLNTRKLQFPSRATKAELAQLLLSSATPNLAERTDLKSDVDAEAALLAGLRQEDVVAPGTQGLTVVATAAEAAEEKAKAGENRAVEHVALGDADVAGNLL